MTEICFIEVTIQKEMVVCPVLS